MKIKFHLSHRIFIYYYTEKMVTSKMQNLKWNSMIKIKKNVFEPKMKYTEIILPGNLKNIKHAAVTPGSNEQN